MVLFNYKTKQVWKFKDWDEIRELGGLINIVKDRTYLMGVKDGEVSTWNPNWYIEVNEDATRQARHNMHKNEPLKIPYVYNKSQSEIDMIIGREAEAKIVAQELGLI